jgi:hypothetical protein
MMPRTHPIYSDRRTRKLMETSMPQDLTHPLPADALTLRPAAQFAPGHLVFLKEHGVMLRFNAGDGKKQRPMLLALQLSEGHSIGSAVDAEKIPGFFFGSVQPVSLSVRMQDDPDEISARKPSGARSRFSRRSAGGLSASAPPCPSASNISSIPPTGRPNPNQPPPTSYCWIIGACRYRSAQTARP